MDKFVLKQGHQVKEVVFEGIDTKYYEFVDENAIPCHRMYAAMQYYNELKNRVDRDYLLAHNQAIKDCINGKSESNPGTVDIIQISKLITQMDERLQWILEPESILKYASVMFFDDSENPYDYDMKYNQEVKIKKWKEAGLSSFFLSMPMKRLFPSLELSESDLDTYLKVQEKVNLVHLQDIFTTLSKERLTASSSNIVESLKQKIQALQTSKD
jgi:hypothetical protein